MGRSARRRRRGTSKGTEMDVGMTDARRQSVDIAVILRAVRRYVVLRSAECGV